MIDFGCAEFFWAYGMCRWILQRFILVKLNEEHGKIKVWYGFGADGAFSRIRHQYATPKHVWLFPRILTIGYKELNIPANADGTHKLDKNFHIWPRGEYMLIALANLDGSFTCTCIYAIYGRKFIWFPAN
jgi:2-polyprenyl-6-methoxyphenol hydroxylase-like FAD-dependent oxidoreductase